MTLLLACKSVEKGDRISRFPVRPLIGTNRGSALVISLVFIILITIVIVGFVTTAALERKTVQSHYASVQAGLYGTMAEGIVASRISTATSSTNAWWVSQPGQIVMTRFASGATAPTTTFVELHSGTNSTVVPDVSVNLNPASLTQRVGVVVGDSTVTLPVKWIYIRRDGSQQVADTAAPTFDKNNPWIGRYAYWTDDESARININTATSTLTSAALDLTTLPPTGANSWAPDVPSIKSARASRPFNSVEEIKSAGGDASRIANALEENRAALTHFNHSPDLNRFGEPRIVLTTQASVANGRPYFDILDSTKTNTDPGITANLDKTKVEALFAKLYSYFGKTAVQWGLPGPVTFNKTLALKYSPVGSAQLIANLIDYVRSAESSEPLILPLRGAFQSPNFIYDVPGYSPTGNYGQNALRGNSRRLHIVEMAVFVPRTPPINTVTLKVKLYCDTGMVTPINLVGLPLQYTVFSPPLPPPQLSFANTNYLITAANIVSESGETVGEIGPGKYRTLSIPITLPAPLAVRPPASTVLAMRLAIKKLSGFSYDIAPIVFDPSFPNLNIQYPLDADTILEANMTSKSPGDPVTNQCFADWKTGSGGNSFGTQGRPPAFAVGTVPDPSAFAQQDTDSAGNLTDVGAQQPAVKGSAANPNGLIRSVGELGGIHSGGRGTSASGFPCRTIRLQARSGNGVLPDWVLLDLFTAPMPTTNSVDAGILRPADNTIGGRIGLNASTLPFTSAQFNRKTPLKTLLRSVKSSLTDAEADVLADNVINQTLATGPKTLGTAFGTTTFIDAKLYPMRGEICEVKGIADDGEASEALARGLVGFLTTQSNVFSVFSVGQKIQQLPDGRINVLGESRTRTVLERNIGTVRVVSTTDLGL